MKKKILILAGGISKERSISLDTGLQVAKELEKNGYNDTCQMLLEYGSKTKIVSEFTSSSSNKINQFEIPRSCSLTEFTKVLSKYIPEFSIAEKKKMRKIIIK